MKAHISDSGALFGIASTPNAAERALNSESTGAQAAFCAVASATPAADDAKSENVLIFGVDYSL